MRRREVIVALGCAAWPRAGHAQQRPSPIVGVLRMPPAALDLFIEPFRSFMAGLGWDEGRTVTYRILYADGDAARMRSWDARSPARVRTFSSRRGR